MKKNLPLLVIASLLLAMIQSLLVPFNFVLVLVLAGALVLEGKKSAWLAFWSGLVLDLFLGQLLGLSSFFFLVLALIFYLGSRIILSLGGFGLFLAALLAELLFNWWHFRLWPWGKALFSGFFFIGLFLLFLKREIKKEKGLKLKID